MKIVIYFTLLTVFKIKILLYFKVFFKHITHSILFYKALVANTKFHLFVTAHELIIFDIVVYRF